MQQRNLGLDILRSIAIIGVVLFHAPSDPPLRNLGYVVPVELFFSISGFLIASMLVERFALISSPAAFWSFMANRWLRTLPLYYLFLAFYIVRMIWQQGIDHAPIRTATLSSVFFLQNLTSIADLRYGADFFPVTWSLCVEEWFYLLCPLILLFGGRVARSRRFWMILSILLIAVAVGGRFLRYEMLDQNGYLGQHAFYRVPTLMRLDVFVYGAAVYFMMRTVFAKRSMRLIALGIGLTLTLANLLMIESASQGFFVKVLLPSTGPLATALCIPFMHALEPMSVSWSKGLWHFLSTRTYAIYLVHVPFMTMFFALFELSLASYLGYLVVLLIVANVLHIAVERPIMRLRPVGAPRATTGMPVQTAAE